MLSVIDMAGCADDDRLRHRVLIIDFPGVLVFGPGALSVSPYAKIENS